MDRVIIIFFPPSLLALSPSFPYTRKRRQPAVVGGTGGEFPQFLAGRVCERERERDFVGPRGGKRLSTLMKDVEAKKRLGFRSRGCSRRLFLGSPASPLALIALAVGRDEEEEEDCSLLHEWGVWRESRKERKKAIDKLSPRKTISFSPPWLRPPRFCSLSYSSRGANPER